MLPSSLRRHYAAAVLPALALALGCSPAPPPDEAQPPPEGTPRLVLFVVVDQLPADYLVRFEPYLTGGLRRLLDESTAFTETRHEHAMTATAPGHATLATGRHPARHGIVGNGWLDRESGDEIEAVDDDEHGVSPHRLLTDGLGDWMQQRYPASKVFTVAGKDRSAVFLGGKGNQAAFWFDRETGRFTSSSYYPQGDPPWLGTALEPGAGERFFGASWEPLPETLEAAAELGLEPPDRGLFPDAFPHALGGPYPAPRESFFRGIYGSPFLDQLTLDAALALLQEEELGQDEIPDLLGVGLSSLDSVGHGYGPDSIEVLDALLRLDRALGAFLEEVDRRVGLAHTVVTLSADHGVAPLPEIQALRGLPGHRFEATDVVCTQRAWHRLRDRFGDGDWFLSGFYLDREALAEAGIQASAAQSELRAALESCPTVTRAWTWTELLSPEPADSDPGEAAEPFLRRYRNTFHPARSPDVLVQLQPYTLTRRDSGTNHGTPYDYDAHVPWLLRLPGADGAAGAAQVTEPVATTDVAPTLAALLGVTPPQEIDGQDRVPLLP